MPEIVQRWAEVAKILAVDGNAKVVFPVCQKAFLVVKDIPGDAAPSMVRRMTCPSCRVQNSLALERFLN